MRKKNCRCDYVESRNQNLRREFIARLGRGDRRVVDLFREVAMAPADRFYISEDRAYGLLKRKLETGEYPPRMLKSKREMMEAIEEIVFHLMETDTSLSLKDAVYMAVNSPAPRFFLTPLSVKTLLYA